MTVNLGGLDIDLFLLVFMRFTGVILFNPIFGRSSVPAVLKVALSLLCASVVTPVLGSSGAVPGSIVEFIGQLVLELAMGLAIGVLVDMLFGVVMVAGGQMDMQMGLGMANLFDPGSGVESPLMGSFFNVLMTVVFLAGDAHLSFLSLVTDSFRAIPPGTAHLTAGSARFLVSMAGDMFSLGLRMALPVIAVEFIAVISIGLLMKAVPQINIFNVGIQLESGLGILIVMIAVPMVVGLCGRLSTFITEKTAELIRLMVR